MYFGNRQKAKLREKPFITGISFRFTDILPADPRSAGYVLSLVYAVIPSAHKPLSDTKHYSGIQYAHNKDDT